MDYFTSGSKEKTILDILTFDLSTFFYGEYQEVKSEEEEGTFMIDYEKKLPWSEFDIFDHLQFRVFNDKKNIHGSNHINAILMNRETSFGEEKVISMIDKIFQIYGKDDLQKERWTENDSKFFKNKEFERIWTIGKDKDIYTIQIKFDEQDRLCLSILFLTNLLRVTNNL